MQIVTLGEEGRLSLPTSIVGELGLAADTALTVETTADGAILLRPLTTRHEGEIEIYTDERLAEFEAENRLTEEEARRLDEALGRR